MNVYLPASCSLPRNRSTGSAPSASSAFCLVWPVPAAILSARHFEIRKAGGFAHGNAGSGENHQLPVSQSVQQRIGEIDVCNLHWEFQDNGSGSTVTCILTDLTLSEPIASIYSDKNVRATLD